MEMRNKIANRLRGMAYQGIIRLNPFMDKFVYAVNTSEIIHFYKINNTDISLIKKYEMNYRCCPCKLLIERKEQPC